MKTLGLVLMVLLLLTGVAVAGEGSGKGRTNWSGTLTVLPMGEKTMQINYNGYGVAVGGKDSPFNNASARLVGGMFIKDGMYENDSGLVVYTTTTGDKIFSTYQIKGEMGKGAKGTATIVGGTGKYEGITGSFTFTRYQLQPPAEGKFASFSVSDGSWKYPDQ